MSDESFSAYEQRGWDRNAASYDEVVLPATGQAFGRLLDSLGLLKGIKLLEVASGTGRLAKQAAARGAEVTGVDVAHNMVALARRICPTAKFEQGDAQALPFEDRTFDAVVCGFGLRHLEHPEKAIREAARVLRPGGRYSFTDWMPPDRGNELFGVVADTIRRHADLKVALPSAPPVLVMADPAQRDPILQEAGFGGIFAEVLAIEWPLKGSDTLLEFIDKGAVRTKLLYDHQTPERQARIRADLVDRTNAYLGANRRTIPCPAILVSAMKA